MVHKRKQAQLGMYVSPETAAKMKELSTKTRIPQSALFREALEDLFVKYANVLGEPKSAKLKK
ncbi:MAG: Ribbon-helix-helix domain [Gammaproteobacteria bacterium]|nr:Ribbon-helix-helix domain [Gammaproteobacteria bacterium]